MRRAGTIQDAEEARRFLDYLLTQGIESELGESPSGWDLWVYDDAHLLAVEEELGRFGAEPGHPRYRKAAGTAERIRKSVARQEARQQGQRIEMGRRWAGKPSGNPPLTLILIGLSVVVAALSRMGDDQVVLNYLRITQLQIEANQIRWLPNLPEVSRGEVWRLVTPIFVHFGPLHLIFNLFWLYSLGGLVEFRRGFLRLLVLVLAIAVASNLVQYATSHPNFGGMSGVVYGLFGFVWMRSRFDPRSGMYMPPNTVFILMLWLVLCMTGAVGAVANAAHVSGLAVGMAAGVLPKVRRMLSG